MTLKPILLSLTFSAFALLAGCEANENDTCSQNVSGCPDSDYWSCPEASNCYSTQFGCADSDECDI